MKKVLCAAALLMLAAPAWADFTNGGFEDGLFTGWTKDGGTNGGRGWGGSYPPAGFTFTGDPGKSAIVGAGTDPNTNGNLQQVYNGKYSARVNNEDNNWHMSTISQTVTWDSQNIYFAWAAVLQDPGHPFTTEWDEQPGFSLILKDVTQTKILYEMSFNATTMKSNPNIIGGVKNGASGWLYTDWQNIGLDILQAGGALGDTLELTLMAYDCGQGGHGGYAYLDGFAPVIIPPSVPEPTTMLLFGTGLAGLAAVGRRREKK